MAKRAAAAQVQGSANTLGAEAPPEPAIKPAHDNFFGVEPELPEEPPEESDGVEVQPEAPPDGEGDTPKPEVTPDPEAEPEPEEEPEGEPEGDENLEGMETAQETDAEKKRRKNPRWSDLRQAQRERDEAQARFVALEQQQQQFQQLLSTLQGRGQQDQQQGRPGLDRPYTDTELAQLWQEDPLEASRVQTIQAQQQIAYLAQQQHALQQQQVLNAQIATVKAQKADYDDAMNFLEQRETARLKAAGVPDQMMEQVLQQRLGVALQVAQETRRPLPEILYEVAVADGWSGKAPAVAPQVPEAITKPKTAVEKVRESKQRSQVEQGSLSSTSGSTSSKPQLTREDIINMSERQLAKIDRENPGLLDTLLASG